MYEKFNDDLRMTLIEAHKEAQRFNHEYVGTEHLLLGLLKLSSSTASNVLNSLGVSLRQVRLEVEKKVQSGPDIVRLGKLPQTPRAKKVIEYTMEYARKTRTDYVGTEHLLYGLITEEEGVAAQVLRNLGIKKETLEERISQVTGIMDLPENYNLDDCWKIPKNLMRLSEVLERFGYMIIGDSDKKVCYSPGSRIVNLDESLLRIEGMDNITVRFNTNKIEQVIRAYRLREILDIQGVEYSEEPDRATVAESIRKTAEGLAVKIFG